MTEEQKGDKWEGRSRDVKKKYCRETGGGDGGAGC